jgi:SAM-dependent methyltransferase
MEHAAYAIQAENEQSHWWFVGRRRLFARELAKLGVSPRSMTLDIGTGAGTNLRLLRDLGFDQALGLDYSPEALRCCREKGFTRVCNADIRALPFAPGTFDIVLATDVIEHIPDDAPALDEIARVLKPGGVALITVPAFNSLWGLQDRIGHHYRRYRQSPLRRAVEKARLRPVRIFYFNYFLFAPIWAARRAIDLLKLDLQSESQVNGKALNWIFSAIFRFDVLTAPLVHPPVGVSIFALVTK